ncbi:MAG: LysR family transcriptional regulator [Lachnospiraceae bacterium]
MTQPSISNAIKALEEEFGVNLFFRNNNKLGLSLQRVNFCIIVPKKLLAHADSVEFRISANFVNKLHLFEPESHQCLGPSISRNYIFRQKKIFRK